MYRSPTIVTYYSFVSSEQGEVEQWELFDTGAGKVDATKVRTFDVGSQIEGCVADDQFGHLYIDEEARGIWKYGAEPGAGEIRTQVDKTGHNGRLLDALTGFQLSHLRIRNVASTPCYNGLTLVSTTIV